MQYMRIAYMCIYMEIYMESHQSSRKNKPHPPSSYKLPVVSQYGKEPEEH